VAPSRRLHCHSEPIGRNRIGATAAPDRAKSIPSHRTALTRAGRSVVKKPRWSTELWLTREVRHPAINDRGAHLPRVTNDQTQARRSEPRVEWADRNSPTQRAALPARRHTHQCGHTDSSAAERLDSARYPTRNLTLSAWPIVNERATSQYRRRVERRRRNPPTSHPPVGCTAKHSEPALSAHCVSPDSTRNSCRQAASGPRLQAQRPPTRRWCGSLH